MSFGSQTDSNNFKETSAALRLIQINATKYAVLVRMKRKSGQDTSWKNEFVQTWLIEA